MIPTSHPIFHFLLFLGFFTNMIYCTLLCHFYFIHCLFSFHHNSSHFSSIFDWKKLYWRVFPWCVSRVLKGVWKEPPPHPFMKLFHKKSLFFYEYWLPIVSSFTYFHVDMLIRLWLKLLNLSTKVCHQTRLFHSAVASTANNVHKRASAARRVSFQINQQDCPQSFFLTWK